MLEFAPFFFLQNFIVSHAVFTQVEIYITFDVTPHTKPEFVGIHHAKGLQDWSTHNGENRHLKKCTNFWTHCILILCWNGIRTILSLYFFWFSTLLIVSGEATG